MRCWEIQQSGGNVASMPKAAISHDHPVSYRIPLCSSQLFDFVCFEFSLFLGHAVIDFVSININANLSITRVLFGTHKKKNGREK